MALEQPNELEAALQLAFERHAGDVFLLPGEPVTLRIGRKLERVNERVLAADAIRRIAVAAVGEDPVANIGPKTGQIIAPCGIPGVVSGRMCIARARGELTIVICILPRRIATLEQTALPPAVMRAMNAHSGLALFSGVTGSGKTTTMLAVLEEINRTSPVHICTVEDPLSFVMTPQQALIQQREVGVDVPDVVSGIVAALRQDPDVLCVGDLHTAEEVQAALTAAQTGVRVLTQLHSVTPQAAIAKLIEVQPPETVVAVRRQLAQVLLVAVAQMLFSRADGKGQIAAYGVLVPDAEMRRAIAEGEGGAGAALDRAGALPDGCQLLHDDIERLRRAGTITAAAAAEAQEMIRVRG